jgi:hypothetical protein
MLPSGRKLEVRLACWSWSGSAGWACPFGMDASDVLQGRPDDHMEMFILSRNLLIGLFTIGNTFPISDHILHQHHIQCNGRKYSQGKICLGTSFTRIRLSTPPSNFLSQNNNTTSSLSHQYLPANPQQPWPSPTGPAPAT